MGFNIGGYIEDGYGGDYRAFVNAHDNDAEKISVEIVCFYIAEKAPGLGPAIRNKDWRKVSVIYNGSPGYEPKFVKAYKKAKEQTAAV